MSKLFRPYLVSCALIALGFTAYMFHLYSFSWDIRLLIFFLLLLINANHQIIIGRQSFSINFPLLFPVMVLFGPGWVSLWAALGLISIDELEDPFPVFLFNRGSLALAAGVGALVFESSGAVENFVVALPLAALSYSLTNSILFHIAKQLQQPGDNSLGAIWETLKTLLPSAALAACFMYAYWNFDIFGVITAFYVFLTIRSGLLFGHLETNYRVSLIKSLLRAVYAKDHDLMSHLENVAYYSKELAKRCGYPIWRLQLLDEASYFHDIGKLEISDLILKKPGKLTEGEYTEMMNHPKRGKDFLAEIPLPRSHKRIVENIAHYHHERYDGTGYPTGLKGEDIPLEARIVAIADTWDAMISKRCYRKALTRTEAIAELERVKGAQLDPKLVDIFINIVKNEPEQRKSSIVNKAIEASIPS